MDELMHGGPRQVSDKETPVKQPLQTSERRKSDPKRFHLELGGNAEGS